MKHPQSPYIRYLILCTFALGISFGTSAIAQLAHEPKGLAETTPATKKEPKYSESDRPYSIGKGLDYLPMYVMAHDGQLTVFADYDHSENCSVDVYVVNRTGQTLKFNHVDHDYFLRKEFEIQPGKWVRAESHDPLLLCGNSFFGRPFLADDEFVKICESYFPPQKAQITSQLSGQVRYRFYKQNFNTFSNSAEGAVNPFAIEASASDEMALECGDFSFVSKAAQGEIKLVHLGDPLFDSRTKAINQLVIGDYGIAEVENVLQTIAKSPDVKYAAAAREALKYLKEKLHASEIAETSSKK